MLLLLLALACDTDTGAGATDTGTPDDTAAADTADSADTADTADSADTADTGTSEDADGDGFLAPADCDDTNARVFPDASETCDGVDEDCDGAIDEGYATVALLLEGPGGGSFTNAAWYGYDADDNYVLYGGDPDQDGVLNTSIRYEWDNGFQVAEERSNDGVTMASRLEYDRREDGTIIEGRSDDDGDGTFDWAYGYTYTADGQLAEYWYDLGADGAYDYVYGYTYDADGNMVHAWTDADGNGDYDVEALYTYDGDHLIMGSIDNDGDGAFETTLTNTWEGERLMEELVTGGSYPYRRSYGYVDADDHSDTSDYDAGDDGTVDYHYTTTWAGDLLVAQTHDQYADGTGVYEYTYEYDTEGRGTRATMGVDGTLMNISEYAYHANGLTASMLQDNNADGTWDFVYEFDAWGHNVYQSVDTQPDGAVDSLQVWSYDDRGRRLGATTDTSADGTYEYEQVMRDAYACGSM